MATIISWHNEMIGSDNTDEDEEFKKHLVREVIKMAKQKKPIKLLWPTLSKETGKNCKELWNQIQYTTTKKLTCLLEANDLLKDVSTTMRLSAFDWLLFDWVLVHGNINVINCEKLPQCINQLYEQVQEHNVENLVGNELAQAWIHLTQQYNKRALIKILLEVRQLHPLRLVLHLYDRGRQCSPMLLQLRWYQLKELSRQQVYKPVVVQDSNKTKTLHAIAIKYQKIITQPFPKWNDLIKMKQVILPEEFVKIFNRKQNWKEVDAIKDWYLQIHQEISNSGNSVKSKPNTHFLTLDSDNKTDDTLRDKAKNLVSTDVPTAYHKTNDISKNIHKVPVDIERNKPKLIPRIKNVKNQMDFDDELHKVLKEQAELMSVELPKTIPTGSDEYGNKGDKNFGAKFNKGRVMQKREIAKRKHNQVSQDIEIIEEGIQLVDVCNKRKKDTGSKAESSRNNISYNSKHNNNDVDRKLTKKLTVFTKKLDSMKVFKHVKYNFVNDKKVIECAILESKPIFKHISKDKNIHIFRKQTLSTHKIDSNQRNDETKRNEFENVQNTIKSTSWLLQKPKNCKYNPIKLCKNPDFNSELKILKPAFLSSPKNKNLLKKCKPLTIDLHKEFEKILLNGTMYVKDFKSIKNTAVKRTYNHQVSFGSSETPDYEMTREGLFTVHGSNNLSTEVSKNKHDMQKDDIQKSMSSTVKTSQVSSHCISQTFDERKKIIHLPDLNQIRQFNQSLLTAEVTPIRNNTPNNNVNSSKQLDINVPNVDVKKEKHTEVAPTIQIKKKFHASDSPNNKNVDLKQPREKLVENNSLSIKVELP